MEEQELRQLAKDHLLPLFSGAKLEPSSVASTARHQCVSIVAGGKKIAFKAEKEDTYRLLLKRSQSFYTYAPQGAREIDVVSAFVDVVRGMKNGLRAWYKDDLQASFPRRVIVRSLAQSPEQQEVLLTAIDQLIMWASCQYEGKAIAAALGFAPATMPGPVRLEEYSTEKFSNPLSNGFDTIITFDKTGTITGHEYLPSPPNPVGSAPFRLGAVAHWAQDGKIALVLNKVGEILVFMNGQLTFARRAAHWHFLTHEAIHSQMRWPEPRDLRTAIYESALDASFARSGAAIGVVLRKNRHNWQNVVSEDDRLATSNTTKAKTLRKMINGKSFHELDRPRRQELLAIDGATVLDQHGEFLAVGAIIKLPGGSVAGARVAAALELSKLGIGIKVSQDGGILCFKNEVQQFALM